MLSEKEAMELCQEANENALGIDIKVAEIIYNNIFAIDGYGIEVGLMIFAGIILTVGIVLGAIVVGVIWLITYLF